MGPRDRHSQGRISALALILAALLLAILLSSCASSNWIVNDVQRTERRTDKSNNFHYTPILSVISGALIVFVWPQQKK